MTEQGDVQHGDAQADPQHRAEDARQLGEEAADLLGESHVDAESAAAADVDSETGADALQPPRGETATDGDITGSGAPMP